MNLENLTDQYFSWLRSKTTTKQIDGWTEITTPYIDRHNDYIQIYVRKHNEEWILTDAGETLSDLALSGCTLETPRRKALLQTTLNGFGMYIENGAITVKSTDSQYPLRKHSLVQAMLSVNDLFYLARPNVENFFSRTSHCGWTVKKFAIPQGLNFLVEPDSIIGLISSYRSQKHSLSGSCAPSTIRQRLRSVP